MMKSVFLKAGEAEETLFQALKEEVGNGIVLQTQNADGDAYFLVAGSLEELVDDWMGDCSYVPSNDAPVTRAFFCGEEHQGAGLFEDILKQMQGLSI